MKNRQDMLDAMMEALVAGATDALNGWIDSARCKIDPAYCGGVKIGLFKVSQFLESTVDHFPGHVFPEVPNELWEPFITLNPAALLEGKPKAKFQASKRDPGLLRLESLPEEELARSSRQGWPFEEESQLQPAPTVDELQIFHAVFC